MFFKKILCSGCGKKVFQNKNIAAKYNEAESVLCRRCLNKKIKDKIKAKDLVRFQKTMEQLRLKCNCGLIYKIGHPGFNFSNNLNAALKQLWDFGIYRMGLAWVKLEFINRGIWCNFCIKKVKPESLLNKRTIENKSIERQKKEILKKSIEINKVQPQKPDGKITMWWESL